MFESKAFDSPDDRMEFPNGHADIVQVTGTRVLRVTFEPGFVWSSDMAPIAGKALCPFHHVFHLLSGQMGLRLSDGSEREVGAGDVVSIEPGHDSWTIGAEPVVFVDFDPKTDA